MLIHLHSNYFYSHANALTLRINYNLNGNAKALDENSYKNQKPYFRPQARGSLNLCFDCAKPNQRFTECTNATEAEKNKIREALRTRKFDFKKLNDKANLVAQQKKIKFNTEALNLNTPVQ